MKSHEAGLAQELTAPQADMVSPQLQEGESPVDPDPTGPAPGASDYPGYAPDEISPQPGDVDDPAAIPHEIAPPPGETRDPGTGPDEMPPADEL